MRDVSDEQLMRQYCAGEMSAFEELYRRYRGPLYRYFQRQVNNPATVNDLYQGSWEKLIGARKRYTANAPFPAWLFRIAHNHLVDHYRKTRATGNLILGGFARPAPGPKKCLGNTNRTNALLLHWRNCPRNSRTPCC